MQQKKMTQNNQASVAGVHIEERELALRRFRIVFNAVRSHFQQVEKQVGISGAQVWALSVIKDNPGIGLLGVARNMDIHQSTASNLIKALVLKQLIKVDKALVDRRNVHIQILPKGDDILAQAPGPFEGVLPKALVRLQPETLLRLNKDLGELIQLLGTDEHAGGIPLADM